MQQHGMGMISNMYKINGFIDKQGNKRVPPNDKENIMACLFTSPLILYACTTIAKEVNK